MNSQKDSNGIILFITNFITYESIYNIKSIYDHILPTKIIKNWTGMIQINF